MANIERKYLAPLNPRTVIGEDDRQRVYDIVRRQLSDLISGDHAYYPDGVRKDDQARSEALADYINSMADLRGQVTDPSDVLGGVLADLAKYARAIEDRINRSAPVDRIELPPALTPQTSDQNSHYVDPYPGPFSPPNPTSPNRAPKEIGISFPSPSGDGNRSLVTSGLVSGGPMRQLPVGLSIFFRS